MDILAQFGSCFPSWTSCRGLGWAFMNLGTRIKESGSKTDGWSAIARIKREWIEWSKITDDKCTIQMIQARTPFAAKNRNPFLSQTRICYEDLKEHKRREFNGTSEGTEMRKWKLIGITAASVSPSPSSFSPPPPLSPPPPSPHPSPPPLPPPLCLCLSVNLCFSLYVFCNWLWFALWSNISVGKWGVGGTRKRGRRARRWGERWSGFRHFYPGAHKHDGRGFRLGTWTFWAQEPGWYQLKSRQCQASAGGPLADWVSGTGSHKYSLDRGASGSILVYNKYKYSMNSFSPFRLFDTYFCFVKIWNIKKLLQVVYKFYSYYKILANFIVTIPNVFCLTVCFAL